MEDKRIKAVKQQLTPKSIRDIQVFLGFANFYQQFIQSFSCIALLLISILKNIKSTRSITNPKEIKDKADSNNVVGNSVVSSNEVTNQISFTKRKNQAKTTKFEILVKFKNRDFSLNSRNIEAGLDFLTPKARLVFIKLQQAFIKASILHYFNPECLIQIETDASWYAFCGILSQLILDYLSQ